MAIAQKLMMRQGQSLVMTPQLSQSIRLLALSNIELTQFVDQEIERNPFLEKYGESQDGESPYPEKPQAEQAGPSVVELTEHKELETSASSLSENLGTSVENVFPDEQDYRPTSKDNAISREEAQTTVSSGGLQVSQSTPVSDKSIADLAACPETLRDKLQGQIALSGAGVHTTNIAMDLIDNLDDAGYLRISLDEVAERLGCPLQDCETALELVQSLDPVGIGARNLGECLLLQLKEKDRLDPAMITILDNLNLLAKRDFKELQRISGLDLEDLSDALLEIQALDPKPATCFEANPVQHIVPDVFVKEAVDGSWQIELNNETLPRVLINNSYYTEVGNKVQDTEEKDFITDCLQTANWLTKSLDQRAQTILKVAAEIVKQQDAFLVHGVRHLRPLTLKMVADEIEMHESSVSRVTSNKFMMTPRGLFELKYFFTTSINNLGEGESHSSESVRDRIKTLVDNETAQSVLSDDAIVELLKKDGIEIARRTVAKYRDSMQIPSSVQRRREKKAFEAAGLVHNSATSLELAH